MKSFTQYLFEDAEQPIRWKDIKRLEKVLDELFAKVGLDIEFGKHFMDRVNDKRNKEQITYDELLDMYKEVYRRYAPVIAKKKDNFEAVLNDTSTKINVPFLLKWNKKKNEMDLIGKTIMRKPNFKTYNQKYKVKTK